MLTAPRICVLIPVFNHGLTVGQVVRGAQAAFPVLVVDDGSTDDTPAILAREPGLVLLTLPCNQGKGAALRAGFGRAGELGFTHVITLDADGQHPIQALGQFAAACRARPEALIVGVRNLGQAGAPWARRASNALSNFWFRFETGLRLTDTQCGYRVYPLVAVNCLRATSERYAFELEVLVRAAWAGIPPGASAGGRGLRRAHLAPVPLRFLARPAPHLPPARALIGRGFGFPPPGV